MNKKVLALVGLIVVIIAIVIIIINANKAPSLIGSWGHNEWVYTFNEDGTGDYSGSKITYSTSGDQLSIYYSGSTNPAVYKYEIDGKTLRIIDMFDSVVKYEKK